MTSYLMFSKKTLFFTFALLAPNLTWTNTLAGRIVGVARNTNLTGAVIASTEQTITDSKNSLTTKEHVGYLITRK